MENLSSKCKNCGSELWYNPKEGCLTCKYCESNYFLPTRKNKAVLIRQYDAGFHPNQLNQTMYAYKCDACQNVYYMSSDQKSKKCPNCGNSSSTLVDDAGYCADGIMPFRITKEQASQALKQFLNEKKSVPKQLVDMATNQKLMGVFMPVWNFSFNVFADFSANSTKLKKDSEGTFYGVQTPIFGDEVKRVKSLDECATNVSDTSFLDLFDEDDYSLIIPYMPEYTYGYRVEAITKDIHDYYYKITEKAERDLEKKIKRTLLSKYQEVSDIQVSAQARDIFFNFAYVPVYVNTFTYRNKTYKLFVSGTTGKVVGKTPLSTKAVVGKVLKYAGIAAAIGLLGYFVLK